MFTGEYSHSIDAKGRVIVPAKFREELGSSFTITMGFDGCLSMYSGEEWDKFVNKLSSLPEGRKETRQIQRSFLGKAATCEVDKQGRVLIPLKLRQYAGLEKDIVFVGINTKVEIWNSDRWEENDISDMDEMAERLAELGIEL
ncbi:MAG: division/cell wall cluster transcriptional repressor MraZ [Lachnospiraceae bacterium]|nr:division/cell wall cluster transcriptional repressor MraZ [Lachnospiraceae bacterium]